MEDIKELKRKLERGEITINEIDKETQKEIRELINQEIEANLKEMEESQREIDQNNKEIEEIRKEIEQHRSDIIKIRKETDEYKKQVEELEKDEAVMAIMKKIDNNK